MVPAGGSSRRMGADKLSMTLGASTVLGETLSRVPHGVPVVVVGPDRPGPASSASSAGPAGVLTTREAPPGGGPVAAIAAGVTALEAAGTLGGGPGSSSGSSSGSSWPAPDVLVVCPGDAPWSAVAAPLTVAALRAGPPDALCAVAVDPGGRRQVLLAAYRLGLLRDRLSVAGGVDGRSARWLAGPDPLEVPVDAALVADVDTPDDLRAARLRGGLDDAPTP